MFKRSLFYFIVLFSLGNGSSLLAQVSKIQPLGGVITEDSNAATQSEAQTSELFKNLNPITHIQKWAVSVRPTYSRRHYEGDISEIKASKWSEKIQSYSPVNEQEKAAVSVVPIVGTNFEGNWSIQSTPSDNSMAVSNGGYIVTANNDGIEYYTSSGNFLYSDYWSDFFSDNTLTANLYDPKVIYDSGADRFVMIVLHGSTASTSKVLVCFSKSNNPQDGWWVYKLTGNPLNNNCWFDYPALGVSNNEVYVTGNLFFTGGGFSEAVIYQIKKNDGYNGNTLAWQYWSGLSSSPFSAFTLVPASFGHQGNYGPGMFFVSSRSGGDNRIRLWDLTNDMGSNPAINSYTINTTAYSPAANSSQLGNNDRLDNGDCRIQNAFYLDGIIHYVFHSDIGTGWNGINYNRLTVSSLANQSSTYGLAGSFDYSYPAVASFSQNATDPSVMIGFLRTSASIYPEVRVVHCDQNMQWSSSTLIKAGEAYVDILSGEERWGDYTGISRNHNSTTPAVWVAGCYGGNIILQNTYNTYLTWIAEVFGNTNVGLAEPVSRREVLISPNPVYDFYFLEFSIDKSEEIFVDIMDAQGRLIKNLYRDTPKMGVNRLRFNRDILSPGVYFVRISSSSAVLKNEKLIILD